MLYNWNTLSSAELGLLRDHPQARWLRIQAWTVQWIKNLDQQIQHFTETHKACIVLRTQALGEYK